MQKLRCGRLGRGIPHVRLQRRTNVVDLSEAADDPGSAGGVDAGSNDLESAGVAGDEVSCW